jgi:hypothetical protein
MQPRTHIHTLAQGAAVVACTVRRYICCNGTCPCSGRCGEQNAPEFCLAMEVCCCFAQSVAATRWAIQDELRLQTTQCDNCIIGTSECRSMLFEEDCPGGRSSA